MKIKLYGLNVQSMSVFIEPYIHPISRLPLVHPLFARYHLLPYSSLKLFSHWPHEFTYLLYLGWFAMNIFQIIMDGSGYLITFYSDCLHPFNNCYVQIFETFRQFLTGIHPLKLYSYIICQLLLSAKAMA